MRYILIGGYDNRAPDGGKQIVEDMIVGLPDTANILVCCFAKPDVSDWQKKTNETHLLISQFAPGRKVNVTMATETDFLNQLEKADVLWLRGGETVVLEKRLAKFGDWQSHFHGKVMVGSSAGAELISEYYYGLDHLGVYKGLGKVPVRLMVHYDSSYIPGMDWGAAKAALEQHADSKHLPMLLLREGEHKVYEL